MSENEQIKKKPKYKTITLLLLVIAAIVAVVMNFIISQHDTSYQFPILIGSVVFLVVLAFITIKNGNVASCVLNAILVLAMAFGCVAIPKLEDKDKNVFQEPAKKAQTVVNFYTLNSDYKSSHSSLFEDTSATDNILDYSDKVFLTQSQFDQTNTENAISQIETVLGTTPTIESKETVYDAIKAFYKGEGEVLVLNESFLSALKTIDSFKNFEDETILLASLTFGEEVAEETAAPVAQNESFAVYIAGNDTRSTGLTTVGRTDVDMIMVVNPTSRQILLVSIPRDYYVENPGLSDGLDKLTHLGNQGINNTLAGINRKFNLNLTQYLCTNFTHFEALVDALGGITVDNPYEFSSYYDDNYHYDQGIITLNGDQALMYARERKSLSNGDYGRNEHQGIIMEAILQKVQEKANAGDKSTVLAALTSNFLTNVNIDDLYNLYTSSTDTSQSWEYIKYHLGGVGTMAGTISMGMSRMLYVCEPIESQVTFVTDMVNKMLNGETITADPLPDEESTSYIPN